MAIASNPLTDFLPGFRDRFSGRVIEPGHPDYETLRVVFVGGIDQRPALIVFPKTAADVSNAVGFARRARLPLAVRSGGHSGAGHSTTEGGIVIDLRDMKRLEIDTAGRTAWAETGLTAGEVSAAAAAKGLAIGFGDTASVGIGGITLGGGVGYLSRKFGLTIDNLLAAEIVTADGTVRTVGEKTDPDLFWAIRGGGGNFGVVTRMQYRLQPLPAFTGGMLALPATPETIAGFVAAAKAAPDELSTIANVMPAPPMPFLPAEQHGKPTILGMLAFAGPDDAAAAALKPFRSLATPLADMVKPGSYMQMFPPEQEGYRPTAISRTMMLNEIDTANAATILDFLARSDAPMKVCQIRVLGGAIARVPVEATAYAHRKSPIMANVAAFYVGPADKAEKARWVEDFAAALFQGDTGAYVNFVNDEGEARVRAAYPGPTWDRLARIKAAVDPENLFRRNQNIPPAA